jgi:hypothetical protein
LDTSSIYLTTLIKVSVLIKPQQALARMVGLGPEPLTLLLCDMGLDDREEEGDVLALET